MSRLRSALVVPIVAAAVSLGGVSVIAQTSRPSTIEASIDSRCLEMMGMMRDPMGAGTMGPGASMGHEMMSPGSTPMPDVKGPAASMGPDGMASSAMPTETDPCAAPLDQMMSEMRDHLIGDFGIKPTSSPLAAAASPSPGDTHRPGGTAPAAGGPSASATAGARVSVSLTDALRIEPAAMTVPVGVPSGA